METIVNQKPWTPSVLNIGDRITGEDVTYGCKREGVIVRVVGPVRTPDCGGYRYWIETDERYATGGIVTAVVFAERRVS